MRRAHRSVVPLVLVLVGLTAFGSIVPAASAASTPSVRLYAASDSVTTQRGKHDRVAFDPGVWIASVGGAFQLFASRPDYDTPVTLVQTDATTGAVLRTLPVDLLDGWGGFKDFLHIAIRDDLGQLVYRAPLTWCPNAYYRARVSDAGPLVSSYPQFCGGGPFTRGMVYGIDDGWAVTATGDYGYGSLQFRAPRSRYDISMWIDPAWVDALDIPQADSSATVALRVVRRSHGGGGGIARPSSDVGTPPGFVPTTSQPPSDDLPNIIALPAWGVQTYSKNGHDFLAFNATEWNEGPGTLEVEGFRPQDATEMDAFQYFLDDGKPVARANVGGLKYDPAHQHWHFEQFTQYSLLDASSGTVAVSTKRSWCLGNTDAIDLSVPNANWQAYGGNIFTQCGSAGAVWIREVLDVGWGDTYGQYIAGQAFNITNLPNGRYYIRVQVNPQGLLYETTTSDNVQDRLVKLRGRPGDRTVIVPPWHGIDTEGSCQYCGASGVS